MRAGPKAFLMAAPSKCSQAGCESNATPMRARPVDRAGVREVAVRDREAARRDRRVAVRGFVGVEQQVGRAAAGRVRRHLPAQAIGRARDLDEVLARHRQHAAIGAIVVAVDLGVVAVGLTQIRRADEDAAVDDDLERTDAEPLVAEAGDERNALDLLTHALGRALTAHEVRHRAANGQLVPRAQLLVGAKSFRPLTAIDRARQAGLVVGLLHRLDRPDEVGVRGRPRSPELREQLRRAEDQARRFARVVLADATVGRLRRRPRDTDSRERERVQRRRVPVVGDRDVSWRGLVELGTRRVAVLDEARRVHLRHEDHAVGGRRRGELPNVREHVGDGPHRRHGPACSLSAAMIGCVWLSCRPGTTVLPPRSICRVDGPDKAANVGGAADRDEAVTSDRDGFDDRTIGPHRDDVTVDVDRVRQCLPGSRSRRHEDGEGRTLR